MHVEWRTTTSTEMSIVSFGVQHCLVPFLPPKTWPEHYSGEQRAQLGERAKTAMDDDDEAAAEAAAQ